MNTYCSRIFRLLFLQFVLATSRGGCLELYYCNMVEWFWWDSSLISTTNWFPSVLWHCWFGHLAFKNRPRNDLLCVEWDVKPYTLLDNMECLVISVQQLCFVALSVSELFNAANDISYCFRVHKTAIQHKKQNCHNNVVNDLWKRSVFSLYVHCDYGFNFWWQNSWWQPPVSSRSLDVMQCFISPSLHCG